MADIVTLVTVDAEIGVPQARPVVRTVHGHWERLRHYAHWTFPTQMRQWDDLTAAIREI